ncbi:MAG: hypothetical protein A2151_04020 [Candidatus Muproteobacteria bacterium RBG_16_65_34]|uniref:Outer membrane protein beta-barrel domain-containing protein n=1 Tax=Candidatus Muproteobacteria bacterium RBG_16_65_34 TaxID=1817760 RepID=A0A1F6TTA2_9PROT|nr:MAG: hypothetical protein A2151_04020 [Candidatus Muproteobacteria bacterium RBG_16_65_34]
MTGLEIKGRAQEGHVRIAILAGVLILLAPIARAGELNIGIGQSVDNNAANDLDTAGSVEYRRLFRDRYAWSVAYLNEGHKPNLKRDGIAGALWALTETNGWSLSAGAGAYVSFATRIDGDAHINQHRLNGLLGATVGRRFVDYSLRLSWQRVLTSNSTDSDNYLLGVGFPID